MTYKLVDRCPECGCDDWSGFCGHFDCGACSLLRARKHEIQKQYERELSGWKNDKDNTTEPTSS